jgi:hypothetical protein
VEGNLMALSLSINPFSRLYLDVEGGWLSRNYSIFYISFSHPHDSLQSRRLSSRDSSRNYVILVNRVSTLLPKYLNMPLKRTPLGPIDGNTPRKGALSKFERGCIIGTR